MSDNRNPGPVDPKTERSKGLQGEEDPVLRSNAERRGRSRPARGHPSPGRRRTDYDPRTVLNKKLLVIVVFLIDALYLAGEGLLHGHCL